jgi:hypothetical protein
MMKYGKDNSFIIYIIIVYLGTGEILPIGLQILVLMPLYDMLGDCWETLEMPDPMSNTHEKCSRRV